jgi:hypothetical protein
MRCSVEIDDLVDSVTEGDVAAGCGVVKGVAKVLFLPAHVRGITPSIL